MSAYTREILKVVVAKICQTIGWHSIQSTSLEIMVDILRRYITELTKCTHAYSTQFGHTQPNLDELGLAFRDMHVNIADLEEFVRYVETGPPIEVPQFPIKKESHLNFLKPGSDEVITRSVHIHEHLPPMLPNHDDAESSVLANLKIEDIKTSPGGTDLGSGVFKRPADISPNEIPLKRPRLVIEEEGRPTREISSVMMTTSGFLSPAREGKLPESRTPFSAIDTPNPSMSHSNNTADSESKFDKKQPKVVKKTDKRKDKLSKELFKPFDEMMPKKTTMKDVNKMKAMKANAAHQNMLNSGPQLFDPTPIKTTTVKSTPVTPKQTKLQQKHTKSEKSLPPATSTPIPSKTVSQPEKVVEGKLSSESNKLKLNIFKKISKAKEDKVDKVKLKEEPRSIDSRIPLESRESSPDLIIDESDNMKNWDSKNNSKPLDLVVKQEPPEPKPSKAATNMEIIGKMFETDKSPHSDKSFLYDDDISPPGTPSTPKTPEMPSHSPPLKIEKEKEVKRKRKDKGKVKNKSKMPKYSMSPRRNKSEHFDSELDRPKTPDGIAIVKDDPPIIVPPQPSVPPFSFFQNYIPGPGLIPTPIGMPMFPRMPLPGARPNHGFGQPAHIPQAMPALPFVPPAKVVEEHVEKPPTPIIHEPVKSEKSEVPVVGTKEKHKKDKKDKIKKKNKKDKIKNKSEKRKLKEEKKEQKEKEKEKNKKEKKKKEKEREHEGSVPKLTLKIGSPRPPTPDVQLQRKILIKPIIKKEEKEEPPAPVPSVEVQTKRDPSPELARISALITRPPKPKVATPSLEKSPHHFASPNDSSSTPAVHAKLKKSMFNVVPKIKSRKRKRAGEPEAEVASASDNTHIATAVPVAAPAAFYFDNDGNKVWICPACGRQDDGSPMIGCDDCDAWYHWVCVGIQVPPDDSEDWYCRICIVKKQETLQMDKKKKRKKKERKEHS